MEQSKSRLDQELQAWREREQRYETLFSSSVLKSREFLKEKLKHYDEIRARAISNPINEDRVAMRAFQVERAQLARQVYPNLFARLIERIVSFFRVNNNVAKVQKETAANYSEVQSSMQKVGLGAHFNQVQQQIRRDSNEFSVPVSYQVREGEKMELELRFKKDDAGKYHFENYKATLHSEQDRSKPRQHTFEIQHGDAINTDKAYNLLSGRAIHHAETGSWKQLDLNDKDGAGNLRLKYFPAGYGFELERAVAALPLNTMDTNALIQKLRDGDKVSVNPDINKKESTLQIEANPLRKEVAIYDSFNRKVTLDELSGQRKQQVNVVSLIPKHRTGVQQSKGRSVKI